MRIDAPPLVLFGVPFHNVSFAEALDWIAGRVRDGRPARIATANLDFVAQAWNDPELQRLLIEADLVLADGFPVVKLAPFFGPRLKGRVTGSDLVPMLAERAAREGFALYGLGGAPGVAERALRILEERHPGLKVAGCFAPPFAPLLEMDHRDILRRIGQARPDILFVALGAPKQEKFIGMHLRGWQVPVAIGVGASLDFVAGEQRRAPAWMQRMLLEWLWRVATSPRRLGRRYVANLCFLLSATRRMLAIRSMPDQPASFQPLDGPDLARLEALGTAVERFRRLDSAAAAVGFVERLRGPAGRNILLDLHAVPWLDSRELGAVLEVGKLCRASGRRLILYAPRPKVRRLVETCRLDRYLDLASRLETVETLLQTLAGHSGGGAAIGQGVLTLELPVELTAATLPGFEKRYASIRGESAGRGPLRAIAVDAAQLDFIDSSGLAFLLALKKRAEDEGASLAILNLPPKTRRIFEVARADTLLPNA